MAEAGQVLYKDAIDSVSLTNHLKSRDGKIVRERAREVGYRDTPYQKPVINAALHCHLSRHPKIWQRLQDGGRDPGNQDGGPPEELLRQLQAALQPRGRPQRVRGRVRSSGGFGGKYYIFIFSLYLSLFIYLYIYLSISTLSLSFSISILALFAVFV